MASHPALRRIVFAVPWRHAGFANKLRKWKWKPQFFAVLRCVVFLRICWEIGCGFLGCLGIPNVWRAVHKNHLQAKDFNLQPRNSAMVDHGSPCWHDHFGVSAHVETRPNHVSTQSMCQPKADRHCGNSMTFPEYPKKNPKKQAAGDFPKGQQNDLFLWAEWSPNLIHRYTFSQRRAVILNPLVVSIDATSRPTTQSSKLQILLTGGSVRITG